jgi:hypothetical protein
MDYESDNAHPGTDVEVFELSYDKPRGRSPILIETPIGMKRVRARQLSSDGNYLFVHDMLRQQRWIAINSIQRDFLTKLVYTCSKTGVAVALRPTVFLEDSL